MSSTSKFIISIVLILLAIVTCRKDTGPKAWYEDIPDGTSRFEIFRLVEKHYPGYRVYKVSSQNTYVLVPVDTLIDSIASYTVGLEGIKVVEVLCEYHSSRLEAYSTHRYKKGEEE